MASQSATDGGRLGRFRLVAFGVLLIIVTAQGTSLAHNMAAANAPLTGPIRANNNQHWFAYAPTAGPDIVAGFEATRTVSYNNTDLVASLHGIGVADSTNWDLWVEKCYGCLGANVAGRALCIVWSGTPPRCSHSHIMINGAVSDAFHNNNQPQYMHELACHETGHTVGLLHGPTQPNEAGNGAWGWWACMRTGPFTPHADHRHLRAHNTNHINAVY